MAFLPWQSNRAVPIALASGRSRYPSISEPMNLAALRGLSCCVMSGSDPVVMMISLRPIRVLGFGRLGNSRVLGKIRARRGGLASLPPGRRGGGPHERWDVGLHAPARVSPAPRSIRIRIQIVGRSAESMGHVRAVQVQFESESDRALAPHPRSIGWRSIRTIRKRVQIAFSRWPGLALLADNSRDIAEFVAGDECPDGRVQRWRILKDRRLENDHRRSF